MNGVSAERLADAEREIDGIRARCEIWELTRGVRELARHVASSQPIRTFDALHPATFLLARRKVEGCILLTADERLRDAASQVCGSRRRCSRFRHRGRAAARASA